MNQFKSGVGHTISMIELYSEIDKNGIILIEPEQEYQLIAAALQKRNNSIGFILGTSGSGKSFRLKREKDCEMKIC
jgi:ABC-type lipoprotein export system ATPase subunit